jgi:hypothetical protein
VQLKFPFSLFLINLFFYFPIQAQFVLKGYLKDISTLQSIPQVEITIEGQKVFFYSDANGFFEWHIPLYKGTISFKKEGFYVKKVEFTGSQNFGDIFLSSESIHLDEITLYTSKFKEESIIPYQHLPIEIFKQNVAHGELISGFKNVPSVYLSSQGGGMGDGKISIRGFDSSQTQININGITVNDMESGWVYWSNWSNLGELSSEVKMNSGIANDNMPLTTLGGLIVLHTISQKRETFSEFKSSMGNDNYFKYSFLHNVFDAKNNLEYRFYLGKNSSDGQELGTPYKSNTYYLDFQKKFKNHTLKGFIMGSPQWHGQRSSYSYHMATLADYLKYGTDYNYNFGYKKGIPTNWTENYFHKNLMQIQWKWQLQPQTSIETQVYSSFGTGGGSYESGNTPEFIYPADTEWRNPENGLVMWDKIIAYNQGESVQLTSGNWIQRNDSNALNQYINKPFNGGLTKIAFTNKHYWLGAHINFEKKINEKLYISTQYQFRYAHAHNFDRLADLLGAHAYMPLYDQNQVGSLYRETYPINILTAWNLLQKPDAYDKLNFHYQSDIIWQTISGTFSYLINNWQLFSQYQVMRQQNKRTDFFNYLYSDPNRISKPIVQWGYSGIAGLKYLSNQYSLTIHSGWMSQPQRFENLFLNFRNDINSHLTSENAYTFEINYQYKTKKSTLSTSIYNTYWKNKYTNLAYENPETHQTGTAYLSGFDQHHFGLESTFIKQWHSKLQTQMSFSIGNYVYKGNASGNVYDFSQTYIGSVHIPLKNTKVGNAAQIKSNLSVLFTPNPNLEIEINSQFYGKLYANLNLNQLEGSSLKLPDFFLTDMRIQKKLFQSNQVKLIGFMGIQNVFDILYLSESATSLTETENVSQWKGVPLENKVFFGMGRNWQAGINFKF